MWWPSTNTVLFPEGHEPRWDPDANHGDGAFVDPTTGMPLPTWEEALDDLVDDDQDDEDAQPYHLVRFGEQLDVKGVIAGSPQAEQCIGYLVKYLGDDLDPTTADSPDLDGPGELAPADVKAAQARRADHVARLVEALRWEPCSPSCSN